jgi:hypothetical protein
VEQVIGSSLIIAGTSLPTALVVCGTVTGVMLAYNLVDFGIRTSDCHSRFQKVEREEYKNESELRNYVKNYDMLCTVADVFSSKEEISQENRRIQNNLKKLNDMIEESVEQANCELKSTKENLLNLGSEQILIEEKEENRVIRKPLILQQSLVRAAQVKQHFCTLRKNAEGTRKIEKIRSYFSLWMDLSTELATLDTRADPIWNYHHGGNLSSHSPLHRREVLSFELQNGFDVLANI